MKNSCPYHQARGFVFLELAGIHQVVALRPGRLNIRAHGGYRFVYGRRDHLTTVDDREEFGVPGLD